MILAHENTLTLHEACEVFRLNDIPMSEDKLAQLLSTGKYNWGQTVMAKPQTLVLIFKRPLYEWLDSMCCQPVRKLYEE